MLDQDISLTHSVVFINSNDDLLTAVDTIAASTSISLDLEFDNNRYAYGTTLCLIQIQAGLQCFVIDPLAIKSLDSLFDIFANPSIEKLMFASGEDLRVLNINGCFPKNVYDIEITAKLLNYEQTSLMHLLQEKLGCNHDKKQQKSNWLRRPLTQEQINYAAEDVFWLQDLKKVLIAEAAQNPDIYAFNAEEQSLLDEIVHSNEKKTNFLKSKDLKFLSQRNQFILNKIFSYREQLAEANNKPPYQIMDESVLRDVAMGSVAVKELPDLVGVHRMFQKKSVLNSLEDTLTATLKEAENYSALKPANDNYDKAAQQQLAYDKEHLFDPIQAVIRDKYGLFATRFIMSNALTNNIINGATTISAIKQPYRRLLILGIAKNIGVNIDKYL